MPNHPKPAHRSVTLWGAGLVILTTLLQMRGIDLGDLSNLAEPLAVLGGAGLSVWGRLRAQQPIKRTKAKAG